MAAVTETAQSETIVPMSAQEVSLLAMIAETPPNQERLERLIADSQPPIQEIARAIVLEADRPSARQGAPFRVARAFLKWVAENRKGIGFAQ